MKFERRFIVQDRDSRMFLGFGEDGDMDFLPYVNRALLFDDDESAALTGHAMCDAAGFLLFAVYVLIGDEGLAIK